MLYIIGRSVQLANNSHSNHSSFFLLKNRNCVPAERISSLQGWFSVLLGLLFAFQRRDKNKTRSKRSSLSPLASLEGPPKKKSVVPFLLCNRCYEGSFLPSLAFDSSPVRGSVI
jgi:hypothetical protein